MARIRLTLVLAASCLLTAVAGHASSDQASLFCATFLKPRTTTINLTVNYSGENDSMKVNLTKDCVRDDTDLLLVKVVRLEDRKFLLNMSYGECAVTCLDITPNDPHIEPENITRHDNEEVLCEKVVLQPFKPNNTDGTCTTTTLRKSPDQQSTTTFPPAQQTISSTASSSHPPAQPLRATEVTPTPSSTPQGPAVALLGVLVVEVVASIILGVVAVMVVRDARSTTITPATTTVRRASTHDVYVCENDLYESFTGNTAAAKQEEEQEEKKKKKENKVVLKLRSITKKQKTRADEEGQQD